MLLDESENKYDLTNQGATFEATGKVNGAVDFEKDSSQYAYKTGVTGTEIEKIRTIDLWYKPESIDASLHGLCVIGDGSTNNYMTLLKLGSGDGSKISFRITTGSTVHFTLLSTTSAVAGTWIHIIAVCGAGGAKLYINGNTTPEATNASTNVMTSTFTTLRVGLETYGTSYYCDGLIDNLFATSNQYSTADVTDSYNSGNGKDFKP